MENKKNVLFVASQGGHLSELLLLKSCFDKYNYVLITEKTSNNLKLREKFGEHIDFVIACTKDKIIPYIFKETANVFISLFKILKYHPDYIVTTGAHTGVFFLWWGKLFGVKGIYIQTYANIHTNTLSGKLSHPVADKYVVQWKEQQKIYSDSEYWGGIY